MFDTRFVRIPPASATTFPCHITIKLCNPALLFSAVSINRSISEDETPCASGKLRGSPLPVISLATSDENRTNDAERVVILALGSIL